ncbi:MAG: hypothetical protein EHM40_10415 [Chloroflexi bacterium]|nr:MAG: hypothetical protein EHM40_10415 [Chloroflexota bacterium]
MNTNSKVTTPVDIKTILSTLWVFLAVNYIYCDHLGIMEPGMVNDLLTGQIGSVQITQEFLLGAAILLEIPFAMIVLPRVLKYGVNRWTNISAAAVLILVQLGTMGMGSAPSPVYLFYSAIEIACNLVIIWLAWRWNAPEA